MIQVRYLLTASVGGEELDYTRMGALPLIPQDFDGTNVVDIGAYKFYVTDLELKDNNPVVGVRVQLYGEDMPDDTVIEALKKEGWLPAEAA